MFYCCLYYTQCTSAILRTIIRLYSEMMYTVAYFNRVWILCAVICACVVIIFKPCNHLTHAGIENGLRRFNNKKHAAIAVLSLMDSDKAILFCVFYARSALMLLIENILCVLPSSVLTRLSVIYERPKGRDGEWTILYWILWGILITKV